MDITILLEAGLSINEAKVYLALLELGSDSVNNITKKSGVHRVNVYDVLDRLLTKGLISSVIKDNKNYYAASNPEELINFLDAKKENIKEILPELNLLHSQRKNTQEVYYFKGPQGVYHAYNKILEQNQTIYAIGGSCLNRKVLKHRHKIWDKKRIEKKINVKSVYFESSRKEKKSNKEKLWVMRFIPNEFKSNLMIDICGDLTIILLPKIKFDEIMAIVIENRDIADGYRKQFNFFWQHAKP